MTLQDLPVPSHFDSEKVGGVWRVDYEQRAKDAEKWRDRYDFKPVARDGKKIVLLLVDVQNTFCTPGFELFVAGRSGRAAVDDNRRLCKFIYRNLNHLTKICLTMDTHEAMQVFHGIFLVDKNGEHPAPFTTVTAEDVEKGVWRFNEKIAEALGIDASYGQRYLAHYTKRLAESGKYELTVWPYHAIFGGIGHAVVSSVEEAVFFHSIARRARADFQVKGKNLLTENYSVLSPEVLFGPDSEKIGGKNEALIEKILEYDVVVVAGQAKSHCVAWTVSDLLSEIQARREPKLAEKIYLLEDCSSPVVIPEVVDYTEKADAAFQRFAEHGMHIVRSTESICEWDGIYAEKGTEAS